MPITIQTSKIQVKDINGTYVNVDAVSDATTAERITLINQAGTTNVNSVNNAGAAQVQAVAAKAAEVTSQLATSEEMEDMIAGTFNTTTAYSAGTYVIQTVSGVNKLYRFNTDHAAGAWNASEVTEIKLGNEVSDLKSAISDGLIVIDGKYISGSTWVSDSRATSVLIPVQAGDRFGIQATNVGNDSRIAILKNVTLPITSGDAVYYSSALGFDETIIVGKNTIYSQTVPR